MAFVHFPQDRWTVNTDHILAIQWSIADDRHLVATVSLVNQTERSLKGQDAVKLWDALHLNQPRPDAPMVGVSSSLKVPFLDH